MRHGQAQKKREAGWARVVWACNAACERDVADLRCCRMTGVAPHECQSQSRSQGPGSQGSRRNTSIGARHGPGDGRPDGGCAL